MSTRTASSAEDPVVTGRDDLLGVFELGEKPKDRWKIGTEHEKFVFWKDSKRAPSYEEPGGIHALMIGLTKFGWEPIYEGGNIIALSGKDGAVSLEPAGQFELSGAPLDNLHETCAETGRHLEAGARRSATGSASAFSAWASGPTRRATRIADHAQGPLSTSCSDNMPRVGIARARHDAAHLHHPDQPRLCDPRRTW